MSIGRKNQLSSHCLFHSSLPLVLGSQRSFAVATGGSACVIQGTDSGQCQDPGDFEVFMPFCRDVVLYRACVPRFQVRRGEGGRFGAVGRLHVANRWRVLLQPLWPNHTIQAKDSWVEANYHRMVQHRIAVENNGTLADMGES